jgi:hypothetical protein
VATTISPHMSEEPNVDATTMKAIVQDEYGSPNVLHLQEIQKPQVGDEDVLLRVHAAGQTRRGRSKPSLLASKVLRLPRNGYDPAEDRPS